MSEPLKLEYPRGGACWIIHPVTDPWGDAYVAEISVELLGVGLTASGTTTLGIPYGDREWDLAVYFQGMADDWRGWPDQRSWHSMGGELFVDTRHDGKGMSWHRDAGVACCTA